MCMQKDSSNPYQHCDKEDSHNRSEYGREASCLNGEDSRVKGEGTTRRGYGPRFHNSRAVAGEGILEE